MAEEIKTIEEMGKYIDFTQWFADNVIENYLWAFPERYKKANALKKEKIAQEAGLAVLNYAVLIYKLYPNSSKFRKRIDADSTLKKNFLAMKEWLEELGGEKYFNEILAELKKVKG